MNLEDMLLIGIGMNFDNYFSVCKSFNIMIWIYSIDIQEKFLQVLWFVNVSMLWEFTSTFFEYYLMLDTITY